MTPEEKNRNDIQNLAYQLNKDFAEDRQNIETSLAWFDAMSRATNNSQLAAYKQAVVQTLIWSEPFRRKLERKARLINTLSKNFIMDNFEALLPMLKDIEESARLAEKVYNPKKNLDFFDKLPPEAKEARKGNEIITEIKALRNLVEKLTDNKTSTEHKQKPLQQDNLLLIKDTNGDYFYNSKRINMPRNTIYYDVFDILFLNHDQDGFLSYEDIENKLAKRDHPHIEIQDDRNKRIKNAISKHQGFFRFAKINNKPMKNKTLDGKRLIDTERGKGLRLNNPVIVK